MTVPTTLSLTPTRQSMTASPTTTPMPRTTPSVRRWSSAAGGGASAGRPVIAERLRRVSDEAQPVVEPRDVEQALHVLRPAHDREAHAATVGVPLPFEDEVDARRVQERDAAQIQDEPAGGRFARRPQPVDGGHVDVATRRDDDRAEMTHVIDGEIR